MKKFSRGANFWLGSSEMILRCWQVSCTHVKKNTLSTIKWLVRLSGFLRCSFIRNLKHLLMQSAHHSTWLMGLMNLSHDSCRLAGRPQVPTMWGPLLPRDAAVLFGENRPPSYPTIMSSPKLLVLQLLFSFSSAVCIYHWQLIERLLIFSWGIIHHTFSVSMQMADPY